MRRSRAHLAALASSLLLAHLAQPASAAPPQRRGPRSPAPRAPKGRVASAGEVQYLTSKLAYLNRGREDGVKVGMSISFTRGGRAVGTCAVDMAADRWATCAAGALRKGDKFAMARKPDEPAPAPPFEMPGERELAARRDQMLAAETDLVDFDGESGGPGGHRVAVALGHTTYVNLSSEAGPFHVQRVDAAVYDVELYKGLRVSADLSVVNYSRRPATFRSVYKSSPVLLVRQLEVGFRRADVPFEAAVGRVWTRSAPGLGVVDGAQASYRVGDWLQTGVYGGLLPNTYTLDLTTTQWSAGAFVMARFLAGEGAKSTLVQTEARVGFALKEQLGSRFELAAAAHLYQGKQLDAHAMLELAYGGEKQAVAGVDAARLDVGWRPVDPLRVFAGLRYQGGSVSGAIDLGMASATQQALHVDGGGTFEATHWLWLTVVGGAATDVETGLSRGRVGPEVTFPGLLGKGGALTFGFSEERGWLPGRTAYVQASINLFGRVRVLSRTSWLQQLGGGLTANDLAESFNVEVAIFRWLWVRGTLAGRTQLEPDWGPSRTAGLASVQVGGQY